MKRRDIIPLFAFLAIISLIIYFALNSPFNDGSGVRKSEEFSRFGDFIGGFLGTVIGLVSVIYIYKAFQSQREELVLQKENAYKERFESRFFEMLRSNRQIVTDMSHTTPDLPKGMREDTTAVHQGNVVNGQKVFLKVHEQIHDAHNEIKNYCSSLTLSTIYINGKTDKNILISYYGSSKKIDDTFIKQLTEIRLAYLCVFFGVDSSGRKILSEFLSKWYQQSFIKGLLDELGKKKTDWDATIMYFGGHQHRLGHYFRNLYYLVNYVNDQESLTYDEKYHYIKHLRSQFSTYEQSVFFFNSLSPMGLVWELSAGSDRPKSAATAIKKKELKTQHLDEICRLANLQLITKYNLIKNVPQEFIANIKLEEYYPNVEYEVGQINPSKEELKKLYHNQFDK